MIYLITNQQRSFEDDIKLATVQDCLDYFENKDIIEVDTETEFCKWAPKTKKDKWRLPDPYTSKMLCMQLGDKENQFVIDVGHINPKEFKGLLEDSNKTKIFANAFFDLRFFWYHDIHIRNIYDVFLAECVLTRGQNTEKGYKALNTMAYRYLGVYLNKEVRGQIHWRGLDDEVIRYAASDVKYMNQIRLKQLPLLEQWNLLEYLKLENRYVKDLSLMSYHGFKVSPTQWMEVNKIIKEGALKIEQTLYQIVKQHYPEVISTDLFGENSSSVNFKSSKETIAFFKSLGVEIKMRDKTTGKDRLTVDIKYLQKHSHKSPIIRPYIKYKEALKEISTYGENFIKHNLNPKTGRIHSEFFQILDTGRISSNNPNLQNIPGTTDQGELHPLRKCFKPSTEDNVLIVADFSQQEPRVIAEYSQDPYLIDFIVNGSGDIHSFISSLISEYLLGEHIEVSKQNNPLVEKYGQKIRDIGKMINLGLDFGKSAYSIKDDLNISQEEAEHLLKVIKDKTPVKTKYFKKWQNFVKKNGYIRTDDIFMSKTFFYAYDEFINTSNHKRKAILNGEIERFSQNNRIQGTASCITKLAHIYINDYIFKNNLFNIVKVVLCVHDEIIVDCPEDISQQMAEVVKDSMIKAGEVFCKTIPMKVDYSIGDIWEH